MPEKIDFIAGEWWRYDRYESRDGYIVPARGAALEQYDPWSNYHAAVASKDGRTPPYHSLLELADALPREGWSFSREMEAKILKWCDQNGLLGVLLHRAKSIATAPRWAAYGEDAFGLAPENQGPLGPVGQSYIRTAFDWSPKVNRRVEPPSVKRPPQFGDLVADQSMIDSVGGPPVVLIKDWLGFKWEEEPLDRTWGNFFPDVPFDKQNSFAYPQPHSDEFWRLYAEPLPVFTNAARALRDCVETVAQLKEMREARSRSEARIFQLALYKLNALVNDISPAIVPTANGSLAQRWGTHSLLDSYAMMAVQDLSENGRILRCRTCGTLFPTRSSQVEYCSKTCRFTAQKRRFRERQRSKSPAKATRRRKSIR